MTVIVMPVDMERVSALLERIDNLEKALTPFAEVGALYVNPRVHDNTHMNDEDGKFVNVTVGDFRNAQRVLADH